MRERWPGLSRLRQACAYSILVCATLGCQAGPQKLTPGPDASVAKFDVKESERRLAKLASLLAKKPTDMTMEILQLGILPDQALSDYPGAREPRTSMTWKQGFGANPELYPNIAAWTPIYVRLNPSRGVGDNSVFRPEGFYLVVNAQGKPTRVPIAKVRHFSRRVPMPVFPGTPAYDSAVTPYYLEPQNRAAETGGRSG